MRHQPRFPGMLAFTLLLFAGVAALPRGAAAQDAASFIQNLGTQGIQALGASAPYDWQTFELVAKQVAPALRAEVAAA